MKEMGWAALGIGYLCWSYLKARAIQEQVEREQLELEHMQLLEEYP